MGELDAATRRIWGFGDVPDGGVLSQESGAGERAKLGIRNPLSMRVGFDGVGFGLSFEVPLPSMVLFGVFEAPESGVT
jgi:hypothetical protein